MNTQDERKAFEERFPHMDLDFVADIGYCESETQYAWAAWWAATKRAEEKLEGCVVVPVEPTKAMIDAMEQFNDRHDYADMTSAYKAMLEAARGGNE